MAKFRLKGHYLSELQGLRRLLKLSSIWIKVGKYKDRHCYKWAAESYKRKRLGKWNVSVGREQKCNPTFRKQRGRWGFQGCRFNYIASFRLPCANKTLSQWHCPHNAHKHTRKQIWLSFGRNRYPACILLARLTLSFSLTHIYERIWYSLKRFLPFLFTFLL